MRERNIIWPFLIYEDSARVFNQGRTSLFGSIRLFLFSEARKLIELAAQAGISEAKKTLETICAQGGCEI